MGKFFRGRKRCGLDRAARLAAGGMAVARDRGMQNATIDHARRSLLERRRQLLHRTRRALQDERALLEIREPDWEDQAANETAARFLGRMSDSELSQLELVQNALDRIDRGTYGICVACRGRISGARLAAVPEAERCSGCINPH
jgi:DnaK suppressor protein